MTRYIVIPERAVVYHVHPACPILADYLRRARLQPEDVEAQDLNTHNALGQEYRPCPRCAAERS